MAKIAVVKSGGKQYLVKENDVIVVDKIPGEETKLSLETLAVFDDAGEAVEMGAPTLSKKVTAEVIEQGRGVKVRVARFKAKVRQRKVTGFRADLTKLKILSI